MTMLSAIVTAAILSGTVTTSDGVLPGATVCLHRERTRDRCTVSNWQGQYDLPASDGVWTLRAQLEGFSTVEREVRVRDEDLDVDIALAMKPTECVTIV